LSIYDKYREHMLSGDSLLYKTKGTIPSIIMWFTEYSHAGLILHNGYNCGIDTDRVWTLEAEASGVEANWLREKLSSFQGEVYWYPLNIPDDDPRRDLVVEYARLKQGTKYDFGSLFKNIAGRVSVNARKLFCSELNYLAYYYSGLIKDTGVAPRPGDIPKFGIFKDPIRIM